MPLTKLQFRPGVNRETTSYTNEGGWFDGDKIRFRFGVPEKIGGWERVSQNTFLGTCRALIPFVALDGSQYMGLGTNLKYYIEEGGAYYDITPVRATTAAGDVTFSASNGSSTLTVADAAHGAVTNDFVTFSGAASLGGNITAAVLNQEYQISGVVNDNSYTIVAKDTSGGSVDANSSDTGNGGSSVVGTYQINVGLDTSVSGTGWGVGTWGRLGWGDADAAAGTTTVLRIWSHDNFGEDLIINVRDAGIYYWDKSSGLSARAVELSSLAGADGTTPTIAKQVLVSDRDRHIIAFGCDPENNLGVQDPLLIRFSGQEAPTTWQSLPNNTAGDLRIGSGSEIVCAVETRQQVLVFTDVSLHAMQFLGPPFTFGINMLSENITVISPLAAIAHDDVVYWMGFEEFYAYGGQVQRLPCSVRSYVFDDFNRQQKEKVFAAVNSAYSEVWWFYPSSASSEVDRYVVWNFQEQAWYYGTLTRTAWVDRGINDFPIATFTDGRQYFHEIGLDDGTTVPESAISAYIESSQIDIGEGEQFAFIRRIIPDVTFENSTAASPSVVFTTQVRNFPGGNYLHSDAATTTRTATTPVEQFTEQVHLRLRGRSFAMKISSDASQVQWRLGSPRLDIRPDGRR
tara:strand:- start:1473 stop:3356 length:1884 start_codon:yes stop_codon:yes gene_type:complete